MGKRLVISAFLLILGSGVAHATTAKEIMEKATKYESKDDPFDNVFEGELVLTLGAGDSVWHDEEDIRKANSILVAKIYAKYLHKILGRDAKLTDENLDTLKR